MTSVTYLTSFPSLSLKAILSPILDDFIISEHERTLRFNYQSFHLSSNTPSSVPIVHQTFLCKWVKERTTTKSQVDIVQVIPGM